MVNPDQGFCLEPFHLPMISHATGAEEHTFLLPFRRSKIFDQKFRPCEAISTNPWLDVFLGPSFEVKKQVDIHKEDIQHVTADSPSYGRRKNKVLGI
jgi:hypothetical protein